jgi:hypothetical protein
MFGRISRTFHGDFDVRSPIDHLPITEEKKSKDEFSDKLRGRE